MGQTWEEVGRRPARLHLLCDVSGAFRPGILTALVGVSGAGKTTLLDVLAGRKTGGYVEGSIHISGYPKNPKTFARVSGYYEQYNIHSPNITVYEALLFSAWLRLPRDVDPDTRKVKILILFLFNSFSFTLPNPNIKFGINFYITRTMLRFNSFVWKKIGCLSVEGNRTSSPSEDVTFPLSIALLTFIFVQLSICSTSSMIRGWRNTERMAAPPLMKSGARARRLGGSVGGDHENHEYVDHLGEVGEPVLNEVGRVP